MEKFYSKVNKFKGKNQEQAQKSISRTSSKIKCKK